MKIVNGKWVNEQNEPLNHFDGSRFLELGKKVSSLFGSNITYQRIEIVEALQNKDHKKENAISYILNNEQLLNKILG